MATPRPAACRSTNGFTLIELLVVVAIIGILAALLVPAVGKMTESGRQAHCANNLRQIGLMTRNYLIDNQNTFPQMWTWMTELADYSPETTVCFYCPSDRLPRPGVPDNRRRSYAINPLIHNFLGQCPAFVGAPANTPINITSIVHASRVFYLTENFQVDSNIYSLDNSFGSISGTPGGTGKHHNNRTNLLLLDGHVESVEYRSWTEFTDNYLYNKDS